jgi:prevent-host-death family protein
MRVVNVKELKARLSAYLRQVRAGEVFLVTDRSEVVARLGPVEASPSATETGPIERLVALGARPPLRERRPSDYRRAGAAVPGVTTKTIDELLEWERGT